MRYGNTDCRCVEYFPSPLLTLEVCNPVCDRLRYNQRGGKLLLGTTGPVSNKLSVFGLLYALPTASHLYWCLFIAGWGMDFTTGAVQSFRQVFPFF